MKNTLIVLTIFSLFACKAQSIIVPIQGGDDFEKDPAYYVKDVNNEFGKFEGEWKYENGNTSITLKLKKELHYQAYSDYNYEDLLVGEYQYILNGTEVVNTLSDFDNPTISGYDHNISGGVFVHTLPYYCIDNSQSQEIKIELMIANPNNFLIEANIIMRYVNDNGIEKLEVCLYDYTTLTEDENAKFDIPDGYYEFTKQ